MRFFGQFILAILGAIALFALVSPLLTLQADIGNMIGAWRNATHGAWDLLFDRTALDVPAWVKDYLTMGVIALGMTGISIASKDYKITAKNFFLVPLSIVLWPLFYGNIFAWLLGDAKEGVMLVFFESLAFAIFLVLINYVLVFGHLLLPDM